MSNKFPSSIETALKNNPKAFFLPNGLAVKQANGAIELLVSYPDVQAQEFYKEAEAEGTLPLGEDTPDAVIQEPVIETPVAETIEPEPAAPEAPAETQPEAPSDVPPSEPTPDTPTPTETRAQRKAREKAEKAAAAEAAAQA